MRFILGLLVGLMLGVVVATAWSVSAGDALNQYLKDEQRRLDQDRYLDLREAEFETRLKADDPCRK